MDPKAGQEMAETRVALASHARSILDASSLSASTLSNDDVSMISDIRWQPWRTVIAPAALEGDAPGGTIKFRRTGVRYPVLFATRKPLPPPHEGRVFQDGKLAGFHACMFGSRRNVSSTFDRLKSHLLTTTRPQFLHVVTSADGVEEYGSELTSPQHRASLLSSYLDVVSRDASTFLAMERDLATSRHKCVICRGFFLREVCRATILSEMQRGAPVELVMIFRPDMHMWNPIHLVPYVGTAEAEPTTTIAAPVESLRLHTTPLWSLVADKGFLPTTFGVYNDINISKSMAVVHCRVTFPLDMHWIGDPIIIGHWTVMNHWLECFSVITASTRLVWIDDNAGETHHAAFYRWYMRPLFELAREHGYCSLRNNVMRNNIRYPCF